MVQYPRGYRVKAKFSHSFILLESKDSRLVDIKASQYDEHLLPRMILTAYFCTLKFNFKKRLLKNTKKQAGAELGQAQLPLCSVDQKL